MAALSLLPRLEGASRRSGPCPSPVGLQPSCHLPSLPGRKPMAGVCAGLLHSLLPSFLDPPCLAHLS